MNTDEHQLLDQVAERYGIEPEYHDIYGNRHVIGPETKRAILGAMGVPARSREELAHALRVHDEANWTRPCDPVIVAPAGRAGSWSFRLPVPEGVDHLVEIDWVVRDEAGRDRQAGRQGKGAAPVETHMIEDRRYVRFELPLPTEIGFGYHTLAVSGRWGTGSMTGEARLILTPPRCYEPESFLRGDRLWGLAMQLYALRSAGDWGIGDFGSLLDWVDWTAGDLGAGIVGLNPLHALKNTRPYHISPYSPDSRLYLNVLYIDVERVPEFDQSPEARRLMRDPQFRARLDSLRKSDTVAYDDVAAAKRRVLEVLFTVFHTRHWDRRHDRPGSSRGRAFDRYRREEGEGLERFALFQALWEEFHAQSPSMNMWQDWPESYRDPDSTACRTFLDAHVDRVRFHQYVQWLAHEQLQEVARRTAALRMPIGLYHDLALGSDRGGSDAWVFQSLFALAADSGCPPDAFAPEGQNWGLPPVDPHRLRATGYQLFIDLLRHNLRYGGAIRLDHVMGLFRLFWIPRGLPASAGAYVRYPWQDLLGILALESVRHRAVIVGEDLGTVPDFVRERLNEAGVLSYRVFYFERTADGEWKASPQYPRQALAVVTTHDLPTLTGFWAGEDLAVRARLGMYRDESAHRAAEEERRHDKATIVRALKAEGLLTEEGEPAASPILTPALSDAIHAFLARTPSFLMLASLEDLLGQSTQINLPGTLDAYPNWSHRLSLTLDQAKQDPRPVRLAAVLRSIRS
ncbi:4-alpha-glucanotransferase [Candidatus Nitrospira bockiana]